MQKCGGISQEIKEADDEVRDVCKKIKLDLAKKMEKDNIEEMKILNYKTQVVAGTNYFVKMVVDGEHVHARIYQPLPHTNQGPELTSVQRNKAEKDEIKYF